MTPGEVLRAVESFNRRMKLQAQEKASYDYIQAQLIVKGISICLGGKSAFPSLQESYPGVFDEVQEEKIQEQKMELSALRFKQFAQSYNNRFKHKEVPK